MSTARQRQQNLFDWISERPEHQGLSAAEIVSVSGLYDTGHGRYDRCLADLLRLVNYGLLIRAAGRPARFSLSSEWLENLRQSAAEVRAII